MENRTLTGREKALLARGYGMEDILAFSRTPDGAVRQTAERIYAELTAEARPDGSPTCFFIGAQPGCGKSTCIRRMKARNPGKYVDLAMDNYRTFHPAYGEIENAIALHWEGREESDNDSRGSDIADFTQLFAGDTVDLLEAMVSGREGGPKYSILYEWAMRAAEEPLRSMRRLKEDGYEIVVAFIAVNAKISLEACRQRSALMNSRGRVFRRISDSFHALSVERIPLAVSAIFRTGYREEGIIDHFYLIDRNGKILWSECEETDPGDVFRDVLENGPLDMENDSAMSEEAYEEESRGFPAEAPAEKPADPANAPETTSGAAEFCADAEDLPEKAAETQITRRNGQKNA